MFHREYLAPALDGCLSIVFAPKRVGLTTASHASHENSSDASESDAASGYARIHSGPYIAVGEPLVEAAQIVPNCKVR